MRHRIHARRVLLAGCAVAVIVSTGCRSGMKAPSWNTFGWGKKPSAEALAGSGPSTTYPPPPSQTATPNAIASVAGGTAPADATPEVAVNNGYAATVPGSPTGSPTAGGANLAAAAANGYATPAVTAPTATTPAASTPAASTAPSYGYAQAAAAAGYPYGGASQSAGGTTQTAGGYAPGAGGYAQSAGGYALPGGVAPGFTAPASATAAGTSPAAADSGYTLPSSFASTSPATSPAAGNPYAVPAPGAATAPAATTAAAPAKYPPSTRRPTGSYQPGSTSGGSAYPGGFGNPSDGNYIR